MLLNLNIYTQPLSDLDLKSVRIINTINPHSYCVSKKDKDFDMALKSSDVILPDGIGIVYASKILNGNRIKKIAGFDIFIYIMEQLNSQGGSCFFMGASESTLELIRENAKKDYPNVMVNSYSPPYKPILSDEDNKTIIDKINACEPDVLFIGMTAPKQEKWVYQNEKHLKVRTICSIGAVFDFYAGTVRRPSKFWIDLGLEWLPRFLSEPRRLVERNLISSPKFILEVLSFKLFGKGILG